VQADQPANNAVAVVRLANITGQRRKPKTPSAMEEDESESESESESDEEEDESMETESNHVSQSKHPVLQVRFVAHQGCVNRVRAMMQQPHIVATWGDSGYVQVWDMAAHIRSMSGGIPDGPGLRTTVRQAPLQIFTGHKDEGFALDWSPITAGRLLSGDCRNAIHLWEPTTGGKWIVDKKPFQGHSASVEDLQWSPTEADVFASCSVDGTLRIWDTRHREQSAISIKAHDAFVAHFKYHKGAITSIEWSPHEASTLSVTSADHQLTIWDLSLERDAEEEAEYQAFLKQQQAEAPADLPPQLLFVHQGQKDLKEVHWHPQIKDLLISTAADGFNVLRPSNLENLPGA
jgi:ribosome assembly protein RRB1